MKVVIAIFVVLLSIVVLYAVFFSPRFMRKLLIESLDSSDRTHFVCPPGHKFFLAFGSETNMALASLPQGRVILNHDGMQIQQCHIDSAILDEANWLRKVGLRALVLKFDDPNHQLNVHPGQTYEIITQMHDDPSVSLWLCYVTTRYQLAAEKRR